MEQEPTEADSQIILNDPSISNVHLRFYSIRYDADVEPFLYAQNLGRNGTHWLFLHGERRDSYPIPVDTSILISNGDRVRLCDGTTFEFRSRVSASQLQTSAQILGHTRRNELETLEKAVKSSGPICGKENLTSISRSTMPTLSPTVNSVQECRVRFSWR